MQNHQVYLQGGVPKDASRLEQFGIKRRRKFTKLMNWQSLITEVGSKKPLMASNFVEKGLRPLESRWGANSSNKTSAGKAMLKAATRSAIDDSHRKRRGDVTVNH